MASLNKVMIIGNLGKDPEVRYTADGMAIANFSLATTNSWKDKNTGEKKEETEWHRVAFYGKIAEVIGQYAKKGRPLYVEGRLKTRKWTDKDGVEKYTTEIIGDQMQLLGSREGMGEPDNGRNSGAGQPDEAYTSNSAGAGNRGAGAYAASTPPRRAAPANNIMDDDDIPF